MKYELYLLLIVSLPCYLAGSAHKTQEDVICYTLLVVAKNF